PAFCNVFPELCHNELSGFDVVDSTKPLSAQMHALFLDDEHDIQRNKEVEASQLANRRALNSLLSNIPGMVYRGRNDRSWTFEFVSDGCIDVTGYDSVDLINDPTLSYNLIIHPEDRAAVWESVKLQMSTSEEFKLIYRIITRKGETKLVQEHGRGIFSSTGELLALEGFI
ncbi:MAG: PAS domain-containing protein, partial [Pseudomonadota bacterium]